MGTRGIRWAVCLLGLFAAACSASTDDQAGSDGSAISAGGKTLTQDFDIPIPPLSKTLSEPFTETITRFGATVTPTLTPSGTFGLKDSDVHVQVEYVTNPPRINKLDISSRGTWSVDTSIALDVKVGADWKAADHKSFVRNTSLGGKGFPLLPRIPLGPPIPLPNAPNIQLQLQVELAATCELDFDAELHAVAKLGVEGLASSDVFYNKDAAKKVGFVQNGGLTQQQQFHVTTPPHVEFTDGNLAQVTGRCSIQPSINATAAFGVNPAKPVADVGVKFIVEPYVEVKGEFTSVSSWKFTSKLGIDGTVAPFGDFFGQPFQQKDDFDLKLFTLDLGPDGMSTTGPLDALASSAAPPPSQ
jgi:hypothetical protein